MKKIIINEEQAQIIKDYLNDNLPIHLRKALKSYKTSLGEHPAFPPEDENYFDYKITKLRFKEVLDDVKDSEGLRDYSVDSLTNLLSKLLKECKEREKPIKNELEKLCFNTIISFFAIPEDTIVYSAKLVDRVECDNNAFRIKPEPVNNFEFSDIEEMETLTDEVYKRRLIDAIIMGGSETFSENAINLCIREIFNLDYKLPELYINIIKLNNLLLFLKEDIKITDKNPQQGGHVDVILGNENIKTKINVQAMIFPILLAESFKGIMELLASHGLPERKEVANYVIRKSDFLLAEPWDMRIGPILWKYLEEPIISCDSFKIEYFPHILSAIFSFEPKDFFKIMKEIFGKTKKSKEIIQLIVDKINHDLDYDEFTNSLVQKQNNMKTIITDEYFTPDELLNEE